MNCTVQKKKKFLSRDIMIYTIIIILFWIPQSKELTFSSEFPEYAMGVFKISRLILLPALLISLYLRRFSFPLTCDRLFEYFIIIIMFLSNIVLFQKINFTNLWMLICIISFDYIENYNINLKFTKKIVDIGFYFLAVYFCIFHGKANRLTGSWLDPNMAGFFYFLLFYYYRKNRNIFKSIIVLIMGLMTFSRLFILCVLVHFVLRIEIIKKFFSGWKRKTYIYLILSFVCVCILSIMYVSYFSKNYVFGYENGISRLSLSGLIDESNYFRCSSNLIYFQYLNLPRFLFGYDKNFYKSVQVIRTPILPHNLVLSLLVNFGTPVTVIYLRRICKIHDKYFDICLLFPLLIYYSFLGVSSYYGFEIILQNIIIQILMQKHISESA